MTEDQSTSTDIELSEAASLPLQGKARFAAYLDAMGTKNVQEIADLAGMNRASVSRLRGNPRYQAAVEGYRAKDVAELDQLLSRIRYDIADTYKDALKTIASMLSAADEGGHPIWSIRAKGVELLNNSPVFKALFSDKSPGVENAAQASAIVTLIVQRSEDGTETVQYTAKTEEVQDADWETADDADDQADEDQDAGDDAA